MCIFHIQNFYTVFNLFALSPKNSLWNSFENLKNIVYVNNVFFLMLSYFGTCAAFKLPTITVHYCSWNQSKCNVIGIWSVCWNMLWRVLTVSAVFLCRKVRRCLNNTFYNVQIHAVITSLLLHYSYLALIQTDGRSVFCWWNVVCQTPCTVLSNPNGTCYTCRYGKQICITSFLWCPVLAFQT